MKRHILLSILTVLMAVTGVFQLKAQEYRDVVFLKNGSVIKGFFNELYPSDSLRMNTIDGGYFICAMSDVARIAKERSSMYVIDLSDSYKHDHSEWRHRGYRGSIEDGYNLNTDDSKLNIHSVMTIHGYQFNQYLFLGAGVGVEQISYNDSGFTYYKNSSNIPVIGDVRLYFIPRAISPMVDVRYGYTLGGHKGSYFNPSAGVDFSISPRCGFYLLVGYFEYKYEYDEEKYKSRNLTFRLGFHF